MKFLIGVIVTLIVGPLVFRRLSSQGSSSGRFPTSLKGKVGDFIILPIFNGIAVQLGLIEKLPGHKEIIVISVVITMLLSVLYYRWRTKRTRAKDWMLQGNTGFSFAGKYHFIYFIVQAFFIFVSLGIFFVNGWLWSLAVLYIAVHVIDIILNKRKTTN